MARKTQTAKVRMQETPEVAGRKTMAAKEEMVAAPAKARATAEPGAVVVQGVRRVSRYPVSVFCRLLAKTTGIDLVFRAEAQGVVHLELQEAGDSSPIPRSDVRVLGDDGAEVSLGSVALAAHGRTELTITADRADRRPLMAFVRGGG